MLTVRSSQPSREVITIAIIKGTLISITYHWIEQDHECDVKINKETLRGKDRQNHNTPRRIVAADCALLLSVGCSPLRRPQMQGLETPLTSTKERYITVPLGNLWHGYLLPLKFGWHWVGGMGRWSAQYQAVMAKGQIPKLASQLSLKKKKIHEAPEFVKQMKIAQEGIWEEGMSH